MHMKTLHYCACMGVAWIGVIAISSSCVSTMRSQEAKTAPAAEPLTKISDHFKKIDDFVKKQEVIATAKGMNYTSASEAELARKLPHVNSPMIVFQSWSGSATPGGTITYNVGIYNPDPQQRIWLYAHVIVGPANMVPDVGSALHTLDTRFPRLASPAFPGMTLAPGATATLHFSVAVPSNIDKSNYLGNTFLFQANYHDVGQYFDRSVFPFEVK